MSNAAAKDVRHRSAKRSNALIASALVSRNWNSTFPRLQVTNPNPNPRLRIKLTALAANSNRLVDILDNHFSCIDFASLITIVSRHFHDELTRIVARVAMITCPVGSLNIFGIAFYNVKFDRIFAEYSTNLGFCELSNLC